jgi:hypothetical protein
MSRTLELAIALSCGIIIGKFLLIPLIEIWVEHRYQKNMRQVRAKGKSIALEVMERNIQDAYKDELAKLKREKGKHEQEDHD